MIPFDQRQRHPFSYSDNKDANLIEFALAETKIMEEYCRWLNRRDNTVGASAARPRILDEYSAAEELRLAEDSMRSLTNWVGSSPTLSCPTFLLAAASANRNPSLPLPFSPPPAWVNPSLGVVFIPWGIISLNTYFSMAVVYSRFCE